MKIVFVKSFTNLTFTSLSVIWWYQWSSISTLSNIAIQRKNTYDGFVSVIHGLPGAQSFDFMKSFFIIKLCIFTKNRDSHIYIYIYINIYLLFFKKFYRRLYNNTCAYILGRRFHVQHDMDSILNSHPNWSTHRVMN